jgi:hypothetical protein
MVIQGGEEVVFVEFVDGGVVGGAGDLGAIDEFSGGELLAAADGFGEDEVEAVGGAVEPFVEELVEGVEV